MVRKNHGTAVLGIGVDIVSESDFRQVLELDKGRFFRRVFTDAELNEVGAPLQRVSRLAAAFALKEAVLKALGTGWACGIKWKEIESSLHPNGTKVQLSGRALEIAETMGVSSLMSAVADGENYIVANVILFGERP